MLNLVWVCAEIIQFLHMLTTSAGFISYNNAHSAVCDIHVNVHSYRKQLHNTNHNAQKGDAIIPYLGQSTLLDFTSICEYTYLVSSITMS